MQQVGRPLHLKDAEKGFATLQCWLHVPVVMVDGKKFLSQYLVAQKPESACPITIDGSTAADLSNS
jgi:hypothetical protein